MTQILSLSPTPQPLPPNPVEQSVSDIQTDSDTSLGEKRSKNRIIGHRRRMNVCLRCGLDPTSLCLEQKCLEIYDKADKRKVEVKETDEEKRIKTIRFYREKKNLCVKCGKDKNSCGSEEACSSIQPNYEKSDMREPTTIQEDPRKVSYEKVIIEKPKVVETTQKLNYLRNFIVVNLNKSASGFGFEMEYLTYFFRKYKDYIIVTMGNWENIFTYYQASRISRMANVIPMKSEHRQNVINHLSSCSYFFSFENEWTQYCKDNNIPVLIFKDGKNVSSTNNI